MEMFYYNPSTNPKINVETDKKKWIASIEPDIPKKKGLFVVTVGETKYIVDGFRNKTKYNFHEVEIKSGEVSYKPVEIDQETDLWYSFDPKTCNFHIVPDKSVKIEVKRNDGCENTETFFIGTLLNERMNCFSKKVEEEVKKDENLKKRIKIQKNGIRPSKGTRSCTYNHWWICVESGKNYYLMSFNRLWCDVRADDNHICNNFGQAQFMCFPKADEEINCLRDGIHIRRKKEITEYKFELMYPKSSDDGGYYYNECDEYNDKAAHLVYNPPYDIKDCAEAIAKGFAEFIKRCENGTFIKSCENGEFFKLCEESKQCEEK